MISHIREIVSDLTALERVSLLLAVTGLMLVYTASVVYTPPHTSLAVLDETYIGETVTVDGTVADHTVRDGVQFLTVQDGDKHLSAVYFGNRELDIDSGDVYRFQGRVEVYKGELQIVLRKIDTISRS